MKNGPSPKWLQQRLIAIGLRPINALVDITNYITFDRGRPLHVFDAEEGRRAISSCAAQRRREGPRARRARIHADAGDVRHRRRERRRVHRRHHGRRAFRLRREYHRCADRIGAVGAAQHRPHRARGSASSPMRAIGSSAASIRNSWFRASNLRRGWCWNSAAASRARLKWSAMPVMSRKSCPSRCPK